MKELKLYIGLFLVGMFVIPLCYMSVKQLERHVRDTFISAMKKRTYERLLSLGSEPITLHGPIINLSGDKGFVVKKQGYNSFIELAGDSDEEHFTLLERKAHTVVHLTTPFDVKLIDSCWITELEKKALSGWCIVYLQDSLTNSISDAKSNKKMGWFSYRVPDVFLGVGNEIKISALFTYSPVLLLKQFPYLWSLYFALMIMCLVVAYKRNTDDIVENVVNTVDVQQIEAYTSINYNNAIICKLDDSSYQIGHYLFKPEIHQLLRDGTENTKMTAQISKLLVLFLESPEYIVSSEQIRLSSITCHSEPYPLISRLRRCFSEDSRVKIKNMHGTGFLLVLEKEE